LIIITDLDLIDDCGTKRRKMINGLISKIKKQLRAKGKKPTANSQ